MSTAATSIKWNKQLPAHSVSLEIYSTIARFTCDSTDFFLSKSVLNRLKSIVFSRRVKSHFIQVIDLSRLGEVPSRSRVRLQWAGDSQPPRSNSTLRESVSWSVSFIVFTYFVDVFNGTLLFLIVVSISCRDGGFGRKLINSSFFCFHDRYLVYCRMILCYSVFLADR